ncbi:hypothetical protein RhiirA4_493061 [Rhizophagus irregularis]|uniref:Uncharacterized protein n=1 Tax=Rhizophagus irregularis TaxID=588596 RepID=A0A2I1HXJ0_9GLOM|nr:hypothetical protein RhiirA4_493061 [Rhizophagus irregularis]
MSLDPQLIFSLKGMIIYYLHDVLDVGRELYLSMIDNYLSKFKKKKSLVFNTIGFYIPSWLTLTWLVEMKAFEQF